MKKKEIVIVVLLIVFGFIYNAVEKGKIKFIDDFSRYFNEKHLLSEHYIEFPQKERIFPATNKISISNPAGEIIINKSTDDQVHLLSFFRIYFLDKGEVEKVSQNTSVHAEIEKNELKIAGNYMSAFPYQRLRIRFQLLVPEGIVLAISNHEGNVSIRHSGKYIFLQQENGNVILEDIPSSVQLEIRHGNLTVKNIAASIAIDAQQADIMLENVSALRLKGRHGDYSLKKIKSSVYIEHAYGDITLDDAEQAEILGHHSKIVVRNIKNGLTLTDAFQSIFLENINGDVSLASRSSSIEIRHVNAKIMVVENSFADISIADYAGETLNVLLKNGNLDFQGKTITARLNIEARNAKIKLALGVLADPSFNIKTNHGRIYNNSPIVLDIFQEKDDSFANRIGQKPEIFINNIYGDIYLK
jgi:DUF4097 and DUF4098 domain-containing protein YvlB